MDFVRLLEIVGDEPIFETALLLAGDVDPAGVRRRLSRWTKSGKLHKLRRGLYALASPFQKIQPHSFLVANRLVRGSFVSCQSGLGHYGLIPERVPAVTSVTTARPSRWDTPLGAYTFRHIKVDLFHSYRRIDLSADQQAFVARREKALLDLIYLQPNGDRPDYLQELRLQNMDRLDLAELRRLANRAQSPKLRRALAVVAEMARLESEEYETL